MLSLRTVLFLLHVIVSLPLPGLSLYFPQERLEVTHVSEVTPLVLRAILDPDDAGTIFYNVTQPTSSRCEKLEVVKGHMGSNEARIYYKQLNSVGGERKPWTCTYLVTAFLEGQVGRRNQVQAEMNLTLLHISDGKVDECSNALRCWRGAVEYKLQVMENSNEVVGGELGYVMPKDCRSLRREFDDGPPMRTEVTYDLTMTEARENATGNSVVFIGEGFEDFTSSLRIEGGLDREFRSEYSFNVICTIQEIRSGEIRQTYTLRLPGNLTILDQNDNGPLTQEGSMLTNVSISLKHALNKYEPHHRLVQNSPQSLFFRDWDTEGVNEYEVTLHDDWKQLLNVTFATKELKRPDDPRVPSFTIIRPTINLASSIHEIEPWPGMYCVDASFTDLMIIPRLTNASMMDCRICIHWMYENSTKFNESLEGIWTRGRNMSRLRDTQTVPYSSVLSAGTLDGTVCNEVCLIVITGIGSFSAIALVIMIFLVKNRVSQKKKGRGGGTLLGGGAGGEGNPDHLGMNMMILGSSSDVDYLGSDRTGHRHLQLETEFTIDSKWEIPRKALILENSIGTGQFGEVYKGRTDGIRGKEGTFFEVAVKMLKDNQNDSGKSCRQEFLSEFSLLQQLDHLNVIKVLGVCTTPGGPLYLVMEYAEFGSLRAFLRKCRRVESLELGRTNAEMDFSGSTVPSTPNPMEQKDYVVNPREILQFSWQIAKGMTYLSDMKMVHRDLAARNVLLTRSKVCKISDFGLTRDIYIDEAYKKKSRGPVPVKWLAPESLSDEVYTKKSDVWSYGILLWELATLGASPYPGIPAEELYLLLKSGYRMPPPPNTSAQFYTIMRECWAHEPWNRPTFRSIEISLGKLLEDGIEYLKLDLPLVSNPGYDYFSNTTDQQLIHPLTYESQPTDSNQRLSVNEIGLHSYINAGHEPLTCATFDLNAYEIPIVPQKQPIIPRTTSPLIVQH